MNRHARLRRPSRIAGAALASVLIAATLWVGTALAQDPDETPDGTAVGTDDTACATCHADVGDHWESGIHANAYSDPVFQEQWAEADQNPDCLDCHTTSYSPATQTYEAEGVTCVACHGEVPDNHPTEPVDAELANESCSDCHTVTEAEFRASQHEVIGLECTNCHTPHDNGLRRKTEVEQCLSCHGIGLEGFVAHDVHLENDVSCRNCHGYARSEHVAPGPDGQMPTGHDFQAAITACVDCHEGVELEVDVPRGGGEDLIDTSSQRAELRVAQLETALETQIVARRNQTVMNVVKGSVGGVLLGAVAVWLIARHTKNGLINGESDDNG